MCVNRNCSVTRRVLMVRPWRHCIDRPRTVNWDVTHSPLGCFYAPADFYDRREEDASYSRRRFFMATVDLQSDAFSISRMCISTLPFGPRVAYMSRRLSLSRWPFRRLPARWRYSVEAVGKFVRRRSISVDMALLSILMDTYYGLRPRPSFTPKNRSFYFHGDGFKLSV